MRNRRPLPLTPLSPAYLADPVTNWQEVEQWLERALPAMVAKQLTDERMALGYKVNEMASTIAVHAASYSRMERGEFDSIGLLARVAARMGKGVIISFVPLEEMSEIVANMGEEDERERLGA